MPRKKKIPIDAVQELADKSPELARLGNEVSDKISINADYVRNTNCQIAMPCYGGMLTETTFMSFIKFANTAKEFGICWSIETLVNESLISRARNTLVAKFLQRQNSTHLMFIDSDIGWEPWHLLLLLDRQKDVIGGLYPMKTMPIKWVVNSFDTAETDEYGLQEVTKAGTGFLCIKRDVFTKLKKHHSVVPYKNDAGMDKIYDPYLHTYFDTDVRQGRYYSEDWTFCENWRDLGGKVYVDKRILLKHHGSMTYSVETHDSLLTDYSKLHIYLSSQK